MKQQGSNDSSPPSVAHLPPKPWLWSSFTRSLNQIQKQFERNDHDQSRRLGASNLRKGNENHGIIAWKGCGPMWYPTKLWFASNSPMMLGAEAAGEIRRTVIKLGRRKPSKLRAQTQKWRLGRSCSMMFLFVLWWFSASMSFRWFSGEYPPGWNCSHSWELNMGGCSVILLTCVQEKNGTLVSSDQTLIPIVDMRIAFAARVIETSSTTSLGSWVPNRGYWNKDRAEMVVTLPCSLASNRWQLR